MDEFRYSVTVKADTQEQANQVIGERTGYDEDYGFKYTLVASPAQSGVVFVSRHPDYATEVVTQGFEPEAHVITVDLGSSFDIGHGIGGEDEIESAWSIIGEMQLELMALEGGPVKLAVQQTRDMLLEHVEHVERTIVISNAYEDEVVTTTATIAVRRPTDPVFDDEAEYLQYLDDDLVAYTGTGRTEGNATYEIESVDGLEPKIDLSWG